MGSSRKTAEPGDPSPGEEQGSPLPGRRPAFCPYIDAGPAACYCRNITSQTAPLIVRYCGGAYQECDIYRTEEARGKTLVRRMDGLSDRQR